MPQCTAGKAGWPCSAYSSSHNHASIECSPPSGWRRTSMFSQGIHWETAAHAAASAASFHGWPVWAGTWNHPIWIAYRASKQCTSDLVKCCICAWARTDQHPFAAMPANMQSKWNCTSHVDEVGNTSHIWTVHKVAAKIAAASAYGACPSAGVVKHRKPPKRSPCAVWTMRMTAAEARRSSWIHAAEPSVKKETPVGGSPCHSGMASNATCVDGCHLTMLARGWIFPRSRWRIVSRRAITGWKSNCTMVGAGMRSFKLRCSTSESDRSICRTTWGHWAWATASVVRRSQEWCKIGSKTGASGLNAN